MYNVSIKYYKELNDFLPSHQRTEAVKLSYQGRRSVKDLIESMGIPHVEVDLILVNGNSVDFSYSVNDGDLILVYPLSGIPDKLDAVRLIPSPRCDTKFVLDVHLCKLAKSMRLMGFDTDYEKHRDDDVLAEISHNENRILLTCDRQLLMRKIVLRGMIVRSRNPDVQIAEVIVKLSLQDMVKPFTRCIKCNGMIKRFDTGIPDFYAEFAKIPEGVISWCSEFFFCSSCRKIYWKGSHYDRLIRKIEKVKKKLEERSMVPQ